MNGNRDSVVKPPKLELYILDLGEAGAPIVAHFRLAKLGKMAHFEENEENQ